MEVTGQTYTLGKASGPVNSAESLEAVLASCQNGEERKAVLMRGWVGVQTCINQYTAAVDRLEVM